MKRLFTILLISLASFLLATGFTSMLEPIPVVLSAEFLIMIAASFLSLLFSYVPGLNTWYAKVEEPYKRLIMAALLLFISVAMYAMACWSIISGIECSQAGFLQVAEYFVLALIANQSTFTISPPTSEVQLAKNS